MARPSDDIKSLLGQPLKHSFPLEDGESRAAAVGADALDEATRTVSPVLTTDRPIFHGFAYIQLDHSPECIKLDRLRTAAPLLENHDPDRRLGRLRDAKSDGKVLRARARFWVCPIRVHPSEVHPPWVFRFGKGFFVSEDACPLSR